MAEATALGRTDFRPASESASPNTKGFVKRLIVALALLTVLLSLNCASAHRATGDAPADLAPTPRRNAVEATWLAVLAKYAEGGTASEGDITLSANRITGSGEQRDRAPIVLMTSADGK